jgi:cobalt/nickel transport system permease protein
MVPIWLLAGRKVRASLGTRQVPLLALGSAFCFTIMMFNMPALGGTTAHPVAGTLIAVLLGPWAAVLGISVSLAIQALFFGDGGLLAFGANCFAMAFGLPFIGYSIYRLLSARLSAQSPMRAVCSGIGAYFGVNAAAALVAVLLGIQPALFREPNGHALYFPFGLSITLPAMLLTHLLVAGPAEAIVTALVVRYAQRAQLPLYAVSETNEPRSRTARYEPLWIGLLAVIALAPLGLIAQGEAWGEWDTQGVAEQIKKTEGREYVPKGLAAAEERAHKGVRGLEDYASERGAKGYIVAGLLGVGVISALFLTVGRFLSRPDRRDPPTGDDRSETPSYYAKSSDDLPDWLQGRSEETNPPVEPNAPQSNAFIERTLAELSAGAAKTLLEERYTRQNGLFQSLDPRAKVISVLGILVVSALVRSPLTLLLIYLGTILFGVASRLPLALMLRRVWLSVPLLVGAIALPATLNRVTPGREALLLWEDPRLSITQPGLHVAAVLTLRVAVAVACANLLTLTTRWNDLLFALRTFFVPRLFVSVLAMTYRYLLVLLQTAAEMFIARKSRTVGQTSNVEGRSYIGTSIGALFGKTVALSEEVHAAMLARGYTGEAMTLTRLRWKPLDTLWIGGTALLACAVLGLTA